MFTLNCKGRLLIIEKPVVMGIINVTPDSFYTASRVQSANKALEQAVTMLQEGAAILDIGGQSTQPGSMRISASEEIERAVPVIDAIHKSFPGAFISVDTYFAEVAQRLWQRAHAS